MLAHWSNYTPIQEEEAIEVLKVWFGVDGKEAKEYLFCISQEALQRAVDYYEQTRGRINK